MHCNNYTFSLDFVATNIAKIRCFQCEEFSHRYKWYWGCSGAPPISKSMGYIDGEMVWYAPRAEGYRLPVDVKCWGQYTIVLCSSLTFRLVLILLQTSSDASTVYRDKQKEIYMKWPSTDRLDSNYWIANGHIFVSCMAVDTILYICYSTEHKEDLWCRRLHDYLCILLIQCLLFEDFY